jgi:hypothetical protein
LLYVFNAFYDARLNNKNSFEDKYFSDFITLHIHTYTKTHTEKGSISHAIIDSDVTMHEIHVLMIALSNYSQGKKM